MKTVEPIRDIKIIKSMRKILRGTSLRNELLFIFGINVGLRISDMLKLKYSDVTIDGKIIKEHVVITEKKTGKTKKFYIGDIVKKLLEELIKESKETNLDEYLFKSRKGYNQAISREQAYKILNAAAEELNLVKRNDKGYLVHGEIGTHTLRKTFGYHAYKSGYPIELLMIIFNHSSATQTLRYIGFTEEQKKEVYLQSNLG